MSVATSTPWTQPRQAGAAAAAAAAPPKDVEWYQPALQALPASTVAVFTTYVGLKTEAEIKEQIYAVRDKAWNVLPYPCIGLFRFLDFGIHLSPAYERVVARVAAGATLLDLGCCVGQDLRKVAMDAGRSATLVGADVEGGFVELGYELFRDRGRFAGSFVTGSVFDDGFMAEWRGTIDIVYLGSFLHLFDAEQQRVVAERVVELMGGRVGTMVFGRNLGAERGGEFRMESLNWDLYRHSQETMKKLWEGKGGGKWKVESSLSRYESAGWDDDRRGWQGNETKQMMFTAERVG